MNLSGSDKATILLSILGSDVSDKVLKYLPAEVADTMISGLGHLPTPSSEVVAQILDEGRRFLAPQEEIEDDENLEARGEEPSLPENSLPQKEEHTQKETSSEISEISSIDQIPSAQLASLLLEERPQMIAFMLSRSSPERQMEVLSYLSGQKEEVEALLADITPAGVNDELYNELSDLFLKRI